MARLRHLTTGQQRYLPSRAIVGRSPACQIVLDRPQVSGVHAEIYWEGVRWIVQDLGSRNGTFVDGRRLGPGDRSLLVETAEIAFGTKEETYQVVDIFPPRIMARSETREVVPSESNLLSLPSENEPEISIFQDGTGRWMLESSETTREIQDQAVITVRGVSWLVYLPSIPPVTRDSEDTRWTLDEISLEFTVSRDEEHVVCTVVHEHGRTELVPRAHGFLLLTLARQRLLDQVAGTVSKAEHGWLHREDLVRMLKIDQQLLNLWVYRARQQVMQTEILNAGNVIERRHDTLQMRIGVDRLIIKTP